MSERIVEVEWEDCRFILGWTLEVEPPVENRSYGIIVSEAPGFIVLAPSVNDTDNPYGQPMIIPRSAIRKVTELRRGKKVPVD